MTQKEAYIQDIVKVLKELWKKTATSEKTGLMSAEDKRALDGLVADGGVHRLVDCTYEEYKTWKSQGKIDPNTFYAITNVVPEDEIADLFKG